MKKIVDMEEWNKFCEAKIKKAKSYASFWDGVAANMQMVKEWMDNKPDAEEKRGKWELCYEDWRKQIDGDKCSACGYEHYGSCISHYKYCPNCGARMNLGEEECK